MSHILIIEGPDGAGKTTLQKEILKKYPFMKPGPRGTKDRTRLWEVTVPDTFGAISRAIRAEYSRATHQERAIVYVWDRLYFSELIYYSITGRPCQFSPGQQEYISGLLEEMNCPIILCQPPLATVEENAKVHEQMKGVNENLATIWEAYDELYFQMPNQTVVYDYTQHRAAITLEGLFQTVIDPYLHERSKREWSRT